MPYTYGTTPILQECVALSRARHLLDEDLAQAALPKRVVLQVEAVEAVEGVLVRVHVQRVHVQVVPGDTPPFRHPQGLLTLPSLHTTAAHLQLANASNDFCTKPMHTVNCMFQGADRQEFVYIQLGHASQIHMQKGEAQRTRSG